MNNVNSKQNTYKFITNNLIIDFYYVILESNKQQLLKHNKHFLMCKNFTIRHGSTF